MDRQLVYIDGKIHGGGLVKVNRKGLPNQGIFPKKGAGKRVKGDVKCMKKENAERWGLSWSFQARDHLVTDADGDEYIILCEMVDYHTIDIIMLNINNKALLTHNKPTIHICKIKIIIW